MDYYVVTSSVNAPLSVVLPAITDMTYLVGWVVASYSLVPAAGRLTILTGTTSVFDVDIFVQAPPPFIFPPTTPFPAIKGDLLEVKLAAGGLLNTGKLNVFAYSRY